VLQCVAVGTCIGDSHRSSRLLCATLTLQKGGGRHQSQEGLKPGRNKKQEKVWKQVKKQFAVQRGSEALGWTLIFFCKCALKFEFEEFVAGIQDYIHLEYLAGEKQGGGAASTPRPWGKVTSAFPWGRKQGAGSR